jgi:hypothetical protein
MKRLSYLSILLFAALLPGLFYYMLWGYFETSGKIYKSYKRLNTV